MHPVISLLLSLPPADLPGIALLEQMQANPPGVEDLIAQAPEIEAAVAKLEKVSSKTREIVERCSALKPVPSPDLPIGF